MKIAVIACSNGLGHIKRDIKIINNVQALDTVKVDLFCESWQIEKLRKWENFVIFKNSKDSKIFRQKFPLKWNNLSDYYGEWLLDWHDTMNRWDLDQYDLIFSDNYIEPLLYSKNVLLGGSFLWHDILSSFFKTNNNILDYYKWASGYLRDRNPPMIVNKYFVMDSVLTQVDPYKVGIIHFHSIPTRTRDKNNDHIRKILIALGNAELTGSHIHQIQQFVNVIKNSHYHIYCTDKWRKYFLSDCESVYNYNFESPNFNEMDIAIIRGGIGTISDCIAAKIPMICVHDENPEIKHNQERLVRMNIGIPISSISNPKISPLVNSKQYRKMLKNFSLFDLNGVKEASDIIRTKTLR
jgi:hypothetical protein